MRGNRAGRLACVTKSERKNRLHRKNEVHSATLSSNQTLESLHKKRETEAMARRRESELFVRGMNGSLHLCYCYRDWGSSLRGYGSRGLKGARPEGGWGDVKSINGRPEGGVLLEGGRAPPIDGPSGGSRWCGFIIGDGDGIGYGGRPRPDGINPMWVRPSEASAEEPGCSDVGGWPDERGGGVRLPPGVINDCGSIDKEPILLPKPDPSNPPGPNGANGYDAEVGG